MEDRLLIHNVQVVLPGGLLSGSVLVVGGRIAETFSGPPPREANAVDGGGGYLLPGFVDIHIHGGWGIDVMRADLTQLQELALKLTTTGTTTFLPTTLTAPDDEIASVLKVAQQAMQAPHWRGATVAGVHVEGPYLNPDWAGAQDSQHIRPPRPAAYGPWLESGAVRLMTLAPEVAGAEVLLADLQRHNIPAAIGHSGASYEAAMAAFANSHIQQATHTFNRMGGDLARAPGVKVAVLNADNVTAQVIADGVHVHPANLLNLYKRKGATRVAVITDAVAAMGLADGEYTLGDQRVRKQGHTIYLSHQPTTLAGAVVPMDQAFRTLLAACACPLWDAATMCSSAPAQAMGLTDRGTILPGQRADLVLMDEGFRVRQTYVAAQRLYEAP